MTGQARPRTQATGPPPAHHPGHVSKFDWAYQRLFILLALPLGWRVAYAAPKLPRYAGA